jgi:hypothetical protein
LNHHVVETREASKADGMTSRRAVLAAGAVAAIVALPPVQGAAAPLRSEGGADNRNTTRRVISADATLPEDQIIDGAGGFEIAAGVTLTLTGDLIAPARQIFFGAGRVDLTRSALLAARPEWWGAKANDAKIDCLAALSACLAAHISMQLGPGDYLISQTLNVTLPNRRIWGVGRVRDAGATRLVLVSATGAVMRAGTVDSPGTINDFLRGLDVRWLILGRSIAPAPATSAPAAGLVIAHVLDCVFEGIRADEHSIGFEIKAAVRTFLRDCSAFRSLSSGDARRATFIGFDMAGQTSGMPGTNASLYLVDCVASTARPSLTVSIGARLKGAIADTFLIRFETSALIDGIVIEGDAAVLGAVRARTAHANVSIQMPVLDGCLRSGMAISGLSNHAAVGVENPYIALAPEGTMALSVKDCRGNLDVSGGQLLGAPAFGRHNTIGIALDSVEGIVFSRTKILGFSQPVDAKGATRFEIAVVISSQLGATGLPAIRLVDCRQGYVRPLIAGVPNAHSAGIALTGTTPAITIETTGIDRAAVSGALAVRDGKPVAAVANRVVVEG